MSRARMVMLDDQQESARVSQVQPGRSRFTPTPRLRFAERRRAEPRPDQRSPGGRAVKRAAAAAGMQPATSSWRPEHTPVSTVEDLRKATESSKDNIVLLIQRE